MRTFYMTCAAALVLAGAASANEGFITDSWRTTTTERFMGNSNNAPPNANAAASNGVRTETTTITTTATGPRGQVKSFDPADPDSRCNNCTVSTETSTESSGPGNN